MGGVAVLFYSGQSNLIVRKRPRDAASFLLYMLDFAGNYGWSRRLIYIYLPIGGDRRTTTARRGRSARVAGGIGAVKGVFDAGLRICLIL